MWKKSLISLAVVFGLLVLSSCTMIVQNSNIKVNGGNESDITAFSILGYKGLNYAGVIDETISPNPAIYVAVPFYYDVSALVPAIEISSGATINPNSGVPQDFTSSVDYIVTAKDGVKTKTYTVTVTVAAALTVTYDGNGNDKGDVPTDNINYEQGMTVNVADPGKLAKSWFTFIGWNTQAYGSGTNYFSGLTFVMGPDDITLYAQWTQNPTYTVTYDSNGGTGSVVDPNNYPEGMTFTVLVGKGNIERAGWTFNDWNTRADGKGTLYTQGKPYPMGSEDLTLYAQWTPNPTYTVTYYGNSSDGGSVPVDPNTYESGAMVLVASHGNLSRSGHTFANWNDDPNGKGTSYAESSTFTMGAKNVALYAQWTVNPIYYTVTYNGNFANGGSVPVDLNSPYLNGATVTVASHGDLSSSGHTFVNWNEKSDGTGTSHAEGSTFTITNDVTLYAQWADNFYTVTYYGNNGTTGGGTPPEDSNSYEFTATVTVMGNTGNLVNGSLYFAGWNEKPDGGGKNYPAGSTFVIISDMTLYAKWVSSFIVGDRGPSGGYVFYVDPPEAPLLLDGKKYLEAAPGNLSGAPVWSDTEVLVPDGTGIAIGTGHTNTINIIAQSTNSAAYLCSQQTINGYSDWFLPSKEELNQMYLNLAANGLGDFDRTGATYWSSSEFNGGIAWEQYLLDGAQNLEAKEYTSYVRCVRAI